MIELTDIQRNMVRHALGFDGRNKESYRNHYVAPNEGPEFDQWMALVKRGLAKHRPGNELSGGGPIFWATRELALSVRRKNEHLSRDFRE